MKYLIFAVALLSAANAQTCFTYACNAIGVTNQCVFNDQTANVNANTCPTGMNCPYTGLWVQPAKIANATCVNNTNTTPNPVLNIPPGNVCNTTNKDTCNNNAPCKNSVCQSNNQIGSACNLDIDCPVGAYCMTNGTMKNCTATVAPGGACSQTTSVS